MTPRYHTTPTLNQHTTWPSKGGVYCTVGSLYMFLYSPNASGRFRTSNPSANQLIGAYEDQGYGSGAKIAEYIKRYTKLEDVWFQTTCSLSEVEHQLYSGLTMPIGVSHWGSAEYHVIGPEAGHGTSYPAPVKGDRHPRNSSWPYPAGHWGLAVGYDDNYIYINDPDTGTVIRWERSGFADHNPYCVRAR